MLTSNGKSMAKVSSRKLNISSYIFYWSAELISSVITRE